MVEFKVVISDPKTGRAYQKVVSGANANKLIGKQIGDVINGTLVDLPPDYELQITGGSDKDGFPMRPDLPGSGRRRLLLSGGVGYNPKEKGVRRRKTVRGRVISADIVQINMKVVKHGKIPLEEFFKKEEGEQE
ncbi:30S ribosomal protein S6e [Archaeoglobus profundus]|uniref:Small ribosomal subunit protein eS6 n=1 Tax=Archaeoglobus profundus (strain DSM 5631 / JCM 9629 / NBRC 100127 / Av18) TaxID=572546 RepID=D2RI14_ARCPA|nr:30S ribosomal protein S6e [Archaeoglobus profundus]ADB57939.1 Ribosomal protein S6e [Archaeoglobus profundus DSM 5631]